MTHVTERAANAAGGEEREYHRTVTYADAGVSIHAGEQAVELLKGRVQRTWRPEVVGDIGGFAGLFRFDTTKYRQPLLIARNLGTRFADVSQTAGPAFAVPHAARGLAVGDLELHQERQVVRGDAGERNSHGLDPQDADRAADEDMIEAQDRQPGGKGRSGAWQSRLHLSIAKMRRQALIGPRSRGGIQVSHQDHRLPAGLVPKPLRAQQGIDLSQPFVPV